jgi:prepilin-type N-terminal cleavage/methylation domain-containing protein
MNSVDKKQSTSSNRRGFTLVETLVAMLVLSFILVATTTLLSRTIRATTSSQDREIAAKLLHECMHLVKTKRNRNTSAGVAYDRDLVIGTGPTLWKPHTTDPTVFEVGGRFLSESEGQQFLCRRTAPLLFAGQYSYDCPAGMSDALPGNFRRTATTQRVNDHSFSVVCHVEWIGGSVRAGTVLFNLL